MSAKIDAFSENKVLLIIPVYCWSTLIAGSLSIEKTLRPSVSVIFLVLPNGCQPEPIFADI